MYSDEETSTTVMQSTNTKHNAKGLAISDAISANAAQENLKRLLQVSAVAWVLLVSAVATSTSWTAAPTISHATTHLTTDAFIGSVPPLTVGRSADRHLQETGSNSTSSENSFQQEEGSNGMVIVDVNLEGKDEFHSPTIAPELYPSLLEGFEWVLIGSVPRIEVVGAYDNDMNVEADLNVENMNAVISLDVNMDDVTRHPSGSFDPGMPFVLVGALLAKQPDIVYGVNCGDDSIYSGVCSVHMASETEGGRKLIPFCLCGVIPDFCI